VDVENLSAESGLAASRFQGLLGVSGSDSGFSLAGTTPPASEGNVVKLNAALLDEPAALEGTLAHEFVHVIQTRTWAYRSVEEQLGPTPSRDAFLVYTSVLEGSAEYVERLYERQYVDANRSSVERWYLEETTVAKQFVARYYFGMRYVNATVAGPAELDTVYEDPPRTTEELIHRLEPGSEPPAPLSVSVEAQRNTTRRGPFGELYVRTLFGTALDEPAAADLADGWGNDTRVRFGSGNESDYAWVLRWDDAANATEFERGVESYLDARDPQGTVRVERVAPETTVLFVGDESFVNNATASGGNATVTVAA
ncbi:MAG: hypothetical protein ABEH83_13770, partial [Halobacterium sp.]